MAEDIAIKVEHVSKTFKLPHEKQSSIKGAFINIIRGSKRSYERQQVLQDVSFDIKKGEFFGIVGRNGSGKSTMLKMLAGIYTPTSGNIQVNGKLTPFIELGVGFNPELTGRENVFLNGALLGFNRSDMLAMYDDIVAFAELEKFMDQKLKNYSSGMQVRLAFSIAIRAKTDILLIDEVLAVGDERFQQKCFDYFEQLVKDPEKTVVIVTHDMNAINNYCDRVAVINYGEHVYTGPTVDAVNIYHSLNASPDSTVGTIDQYTPQYLKKITVRTHDKKPVKELRPGDDLFVELELMKADKVGGVGVAIFDAKTNSYCYGTNTFIDDFSPHSDSVTLQISHTERLLPGTYYCKIGIFKNRDTQVLEFFENLGGFTIAGSATTHGFVNLTSKWS